MKNTIKAILLLAMSAIAPMSFAATATAQFNATLNVQGTCGFNQPSYSATLNSQPNINNSGTNFTIQYQCSAGLSPTLTTTPVAVSAGAATITSYLYPDQAGSPGTTDITTAPFALTADGTLRSQNMWVIFKATNTAGGGYPIGNYTFPMTMTINY